MWYTKWLLPLLVAGARAAPATTVQDNVSTVEKDGVTYTVFEHAATGSKMEYVKNSGICETTPGVNQYSGYLSIGDNMNMWFWLVPFTSIENIIDASLISTGSSRLATALSKLPWLLGSMAVLAALP